MMSNNKRQLLFGLCGTLVLAAAGVWAAGDAAPPQLTALSAKAGRRITTLRGKEIGISPAIAFMSEA